MDAILEVPAARDEYNVNRNDSHWSRVYLGSQLFYFFHSKLSGSFDKMSYIFSAYNFF